MNNEHLREIEIGGVKFEVDLRTAKKIDSFRIGDKVKILKKQYGGSYQTLLGVIVAFDNFKALPTITTCCISYTGDLEFDYINTETQDIEICACTDDIILEQGEITSRINRAIETKIKELEDLQRKKKYFLDRFGAWFNCDNE